MTETIHCKLVAKKEGLYSNYVFQSDSGKYYMCTKLPKWGPLMINIGDSGFLTYESAQAGEAYFDRSSETFQKYQFTNNYLKEFIQDSKNLNQITL